jgi:hypothetical protein
VTKQYVAVSACGTSGEGAVGEDQGESVGEVLLADEIEDFVEVLLGLADG